MLDIIAKCTITILKSSFFGSYPPFISFFQKLNVKRQRGIQVMLHPQMLCTCMRQR